MPTLRNKTGATYEPVLLKVSGHSNSILACNWILFKGVILVSRREFVLPHLEWEAFVEPFSITTIFEDERLPKGKTTFHVSRDENYKFQVIMKFKDPSFVSAPGKSSDVPGSLAEYMDIGIKGSGPKPFSYTLKSALVSGPHIEISEESGFSGTSTIHLGGLLMKTENKNEGTHLTEWFLNGPEDLVFSRVTNRKVRRAFSRERLETKDLRLDSIEISPEKRAKENSLEKFDSIDTPLETSSKRVDFLKVETNDRQFLVEKVLDGIGPDWSSNVAIEYRKTWGGIPTVAEREEISEVCSFVFGRQLLLIGNTLFDQDENIVEAYGCDPWVRSAKSFCREPAFPPINVTAAPFNNKAEMVINELLQRYHEVCEHLFYKEAIWNYWISRQMPLGTNLPILAAGIESIINGWFNYTKSKSKGFFLEKDRFAELLKEDLINIQKKLIGIPDGEKILEKIMRANEFGIAERYRRFFQEIGLSVAPEEWEAIKERSRFVHGEELFDKVDWRQVAQKTQAFETLFNKIFLKLLEYKGDFVNRSVSGWPDTQLT
jgi:hypothetical protein